MTKLSKQKAIESFLTELDLRLQLISSLGTALDRVGLTKAAEEIDDLIREIRHSTKVFSLQLQLNEKPDSE